MNLTNPSGGTDLAVLSRDIQRIHGLREAPKTIQVDWTNGPYNARLGKIGNYGDATDDVKLSHENINATLRLLKARNGTDRLVAYLVL